MPNQGTGGVTAGVPADQMAFLQQIGTMVQSVMEPFAQQLTVEVSQLEAKVDMIQTELQAEIADAQRCNNTSCLPRRAVEHLSDGVW